MNVTVKRSLIVETGILQIIGIVSGTVNANGRYGETNIIGIRKRIKKESRNIHQFLQ
jgi:hypothetical protein